jgi:hypothetical protein
MPPRYGVSPSYLPLWRRYRDDCSPCYARPWRRFYDDPERAWAGIIPSDRLNRGGSGARPAGGLSRGLRPVGPMATSQGRPGGGQFWEGSGTPESGPGPVRACLGYGPDGRVYPSGHTPGQPSAVCRDQVSTSLAEHPAADGPRSGIADLGHAPVAATRAGSRPDRHREQAPRITEQDSHQSTGLRISGCTPLPHYKTLDQQPEHRGGEP